MTTLILQLKQEKQSLLKKINNATDFLQTWADRYHQRKDLLEIDSRLLKDIGLTREDVLQESAKPFWKQ